MRLALLVLIPFVVGGGIPSTAMHAPRAAHTATLLLDGDVLLTGGCSVDSCELDARGATTELFDAKAGRFIAGPKMSAPRVGHIAARLRDGRVLAAGGWTVSGLTASAELYDPEAREFTKAGTLKLARGGATATLLRDGRVLVTGGSVGARVTRTAELYEPGKRRFVPTGSMRSPRGGHVAVALRDGRVLVVGGSDGTRVLATTELFDSRTRRFSPGPRLRVARHKHAAVSLLDGKVLVVGGSGMADSRGRYAAAEIVDVTRRRTRSVGPLAHRRFKLPDAAVRLANGSVLVAGGSSWLERYEQRSRRFWIAGRIDRSLGFSTATLLRDGRVLVAGGYDDALEVSRVAWIVTP